MISEGLSVSYFAFVANPKNWKKLLCSLVSLCLRGKFLVSLLFFKKLPQHILQNTTMPIVFNFYFAVKPAQCFECF
jgi:hypothetical protein